MPLPLLLGILAAAQYGQQYLKDKRDEENASQYRGLLGQPPRAMGPADEAGNMGQMPGYGLLADPRDVNRQIEFASGVAGMRGQQANGLMLLNAAFTRAQQEAERAQQGRQYEEGAARQQSQFDQTFGAGRADRAAEQDRWSQDMALRLKDFTRQGLWSDRNYGLAERAAGRGDAELALAENRDRREAAAANAPGGMPKLSPGWGYQIGPDGTPIAAPVPGTTDYAKGVEGAQNLQSVDDRVGQMLDMIEGKEETTRGGKKVRIGGSGSEMFGQRASQYSVLRGQLISDLGKLREQGVLDQKEYDRLSDQIADPTTMGSYLTRNSTMGAGYEAMRELFRGKLNQHYKANPWLVPAKPAGFQ